MSTLRTLAVAVAAVVGTAACSAAPRGPSAGPLPAGERTTVEVSNFNWADMVVYAVRGGMRHRLGMVVSMSSDRFRLPPAMDAPGADVRLLADPIGSARAFATEPILAAPGQRIEFTIQNHLAISSYAVRNP